jgi:PEP-CTERM motif-containing protein
MISLWKKNAIAAAVALSSLCFVGAAHAVVDTPEEGSFGLLSAPNSVAFTGHESGGLVAMSDEVTFSVESLSASNVGTISSSIGGTGFGTFGTSLWDVADDTGPLATGSVTNLSGFWFSVFSFAPLTTGSDYSIHIDGVTLAGSETATYSGTMAVSAIPEPETYAMMLAGLGLMGFIARRRKQNDAAA